VTLKYYSHLNLTYNRGLAVWLLKSVQNEWENPYNRKNWVHSREDSFLSSNTYKRTTQHEESYERENAEHKELYRSSLHLHDRLSWFHISHISRYSCLNINCLNIILISRISWLYEQFLHEAVHGENESKLIFSMLTSQLIYVWRKESKVQALTITNWC